MTILNSPAPQHQQKIEHIVTSSATTQFQFADAPVCMEGKSEVVVGALKQETVSLICSVESHPAPQSFHWTFNNSGDLIEVPHSRYSHTTIPTAQSHSQPHQQHLQQQQQQQQQVATELKEYQQFHGSRMNYTPSTEMDYGTVACWASNQVGRQRAPCLFQVNPHLCTS